MAMIKHIVFGDTYYYKFLTFVYSLQITLRV